MSDSLDKDYWQQHVQRCIEMGSTRSSESAAGGINTLQFETALITSVEVREEKGSPVAYLPTTMKKGMSFILFSSDSVLINMSGLLQGRLADRAVIEMQMRLAQVLRVVLVAWVALARRYKNILPSRIQSAHSYRRTRVFSLVVNSY